MYIGTSMEVTHSDLCKKVSECESLIKTYGDELLEAHRVGDWEKVQFMANAILDKLFMRNLSLTWISTTKEAQEAKSLKDENESLKRVLREVFK